MFRKDCDVWGEIRLYRSLLLQFAQRQAGKMDELFRAVRQGNLKDVAALAHTVKGAAANLGIDRLATLSHTLESFAREGTLPGDQSLNEWGAELALVVQNLAALEAPSPENTSSALAYDAEQVSQTVRKLCLALDSDLGEAFEVLERLEELTKKTSLSSTCGDLRKSIDDFDVDSAKALAAQILRQVEGR